MEMWIFFPFLNKQGGIYGNVARVGDSEGKRN